jgi:hypothetical protein
MVENLLERIHSSGSGTSGLQAIMWTRASHFVLKKYPFMKQAWRFSG